MQDGIFITEDRCGLTGGITQFAADVVARLVARDGAPHAPLKNPLVERFMQAVRSSDPMAFQEFQPELKRARISYATLADCYIPEVARRLGKGWDDDEISFADVTIGVARLQAILREIGTRWVADEAELPGQATMLLILPASEQHTLGAMVIAGWLRRKGISVCLRIAPSLTDVAALLALRRFDGAMISVAGCDKLDVCAKLVKTLKSEAAGGLFVAVGGAGLEKVDDVAAATGADLVTNDLSLAIQAMGLAPPLAATTMIT